MGKDNRVAACKHCIQCAVTPVTLQKAVYVYWEDYLHQGSPMAVLNV